MASIQIEERQPVLVTTTHTLLRVALGGVVLLEAIERMTHFGAFEQWVAQLGIGDPQHDAPLLARTLLVLAVVLGACLLFGLLTRLAAVLTIGVGAVGLWSWQRAANLPFGSGFELACLLMACAAYLFATGASVLSLDTVFRRRAVRRAIERDPIWNRAPYRMPRDASRGR